MRKMGWFLAAFGLMALSACVTINVYFPAAEAQEAAREFVEKVIGDEMPGGQPPAPVPQQDGGGMALLSFFISSAHAQTPDITIRTPAIQAIQARMADRFQNQLAAHFDSGALGDAGLGVAQASEERLIVGVFAQPEAGGDTGAELARGFLGGVLRRLVRRALGFKGAGQLLNGGGEFLHAGRVGVRVAHAAPPSRARSAASFCASPESPFPMREPNREEVVRSACSTIPRTLSSPERRDTSGRAN